MIVNGPDAIVHRDTLVPIDREGAAKSGVSGRVEEWEKNRFEDQDVIGDLEHTA